MIGAAVKGDADFEERTASYEAMLQRGQIPPTSLLSMKQTIELIYEVTFCRASVPH